MTTQNELSELAQEMVAAPVGEGKVLAGVPELVRATAAEGCVIVKNDGVLPLGKETVISVFGRCQINTFLVGYGSGGNVHAPYKVTILEGLKACEGITLNESLCAIYETWCKENVPDQGTWGNWPMSYPEMKVSRELVEKAAKSSDVALIVIGRAAGEERENRLEAGSYFLTEEEKELLSLVTEEFDKTIVVMDCGNVIDMAWVEEYPLSAVVLPWLSGMEAGNALADILCGKLNPSGKLSDTIAKSYEDYPSAANFGNEEFNFYEEDIFVGYRYFETFAKEKVLYPFGFGLSYTTFQVEKEAFEVEKDDKNQVKAIKLTAKVTNTGACAGREVVQLYLIAPQGKLGKAAKSLVAFQKTEELKPQESEVITLRAEAWLFASYDEEGKTGYSSSYVLEKGNYGCFLGTSVRDGAVVAEFNVEKTELISALEPVCPVQHSFDRMIVEKKDETGKNEYLMGKEAVKVPEPVLKQRILECLPEEIKPTGNKGLMFSQVVKGEVTVEEFIAQLSDEELEALTRGEGGMQTTFGARGNTGIFGGTIASLRGRGVKPIVTADGPAGLRIEDFATLLPCGTAIACTFHPELIQKMFEKIGEELILNKVDIILSPGMNIHRNPLCGRNFEYYSEDPLVAGRMAVATVRGIQSKGVSACPKHFAANNQEVKRHRNDSRMTERALREIYMKGFEICVKEGKPQNIMTSYNKVNGVWSHYNYDLVTTVLRGEWGYTGNVMTDWWMQKSASPEFPEMEDNAYRVRAQVDVLMPGDMGRNREYQSDGTLLKTLGKEEGITRAELQRTAKNVLNLACWLSGREGRKPQ